MKFIQFASSYGPTAIEITLHYILLLTKMDKRDSESLKVSDGDKFAIWKYHMEIYFDEKDIMPIVNGTNPKPPDGAPEAERVAWSKTNTQARRIINSSVSLPVLDNLVNCSTVTCMWATLIHFISKNRKRISTCCRIASLSIR